MRRNKLIQWALDLIGWDDSFDFEKDITYALLFVALLLAIMALLAIILMR